MEPNRSGIVFLLAILTYAMAKEGIGVVGDIGFELIPITLVVTDLLAMRTNGDDTAEHFDLRHRFAQ